MSCYSYIDAGFFARGTYTNLGVWIRTVSNLEIYLGETDSYKIGGSFELLKSLSVNGFGSRSLSILRLGDSCLYSKLWIDGIALICSVSLAP